LVEKQYGQELTLSSDEEYLNHFREWERPTVPWGVLPTVPEDSPPDRVFADQSLRRNNSLSQIYYPTLTADRQPPLIAPPIPASLQELHTLSTPTQLSSKLLSMDVGNNTYLDERSLPLYSCSNDAKLSIESMQQDLKAVSSRRLRTKDTSMEESLDPS
jgi:hypothetical protein